MKKLEDKVKRHEMKAKRALLRRQAVKLSRQAAKFRQDALKAGAEATVAGSNIYHHHPAYEDLVLPLLEEAHKLCERYGFDVIFHTRTPMKGMPDFTHVIAGFCDQPTGTMGQCLELIRQQKAIAVKNGKLVEIETPIKTNEKEAE